MIIKTKSINKGFLGDYMKKDKNILRKTHLKRTTERIQLDMCIRCLKDISHAGEHLKGFLWAKVIADKTLKKLDII